MSNSKAQTAIKKAVSDHFNEGVDLNTTAMILTQNGVAFTDIQSTIQSVAVKNDWVLTPEKIKAKVEKAIEGKVISHFLDVVQLAKSLDLAQLSQAEKQKAVIDFSGVEKSKVVEGKKFKQFNNSGHMGKLAQWVIDNPEFTPEQIHNSGVVVAVNASDYYDEFLAYREFFRTLEA